MGIVRLIYDETLRQMKKVGKVAEPDIEETRRIAAGKLRYCLQDNVLYLPQDLSLVEQGHRLCWGRIRLEEIEEMPWLAEFDREVPEDPLAYHTPFTGIGFGAVYSRRHRETPRGRRAVGEFVAQALIDAVAKDPDVLLEVSRSDFEALVAELFARKGLEVDLLRTTKDDGIDFLAVQAEGPVDPVVVAVQCKHPDRVTGDKRRRTLPVAVVREIYGVAKAHDLRGAVAITSAEYSDAARRFAELKPEEIQVNNGRDVVAWARKYRWNTDE